MKTTRKHQKSLKTLLDGVLILTEYLKKLKEKITEEELNIIDKGEVIANIILAQRDLESAYFRTEEAKRKLIN